MSVFLVPDVMEMPTVELRLLGVIIDVRMDGIEGYQQKAETHQ